jgi:hypothetical protein
LAFVSALPEKHESAGADRGRDDRDDDADAALIPTDVSEFHNMIPGWQVAGDNGLRTGRNRFDRNSIHAGVPAGEPKLQQLGFARC